MTIFGDFLRPVFSANRVQHVSDLHPKFALGPHHVYKQVWQTSSLQRLRLGEQKKERKKRKRIEVTTGQKYNVRVSYAGRP